MLDIHCITSNKMIHNSFYHNYDSVYQALDVVFHDQVKHREESWKYDAQQSIFEELQGISSGDETMCWMLDITSQTT